MRLQLLPISQVPRVLRERGIALVPAPYDPDWTVLEGPPFNDNPASGGAGGGGGGGGPTVSSPLPAAGSLQTDPEAVTMLSVPIPGAGAFNSSLPFVQRQTNRGLLIVQNSSIAGAGGVAPVLYMDFNKNAAVGQSLAIFPGVALIADRRVPIDTLYFVWGPGTPPFTYGGYLGQGLLGTSG